MAEAEKRKDQEPLEDSESEDLVPKRVPESDLADLRDEEGENKKQIICTRCPSIVLQPKLAKLVEKELFLPFPHQKKDKAPLQGETLADFWLVSDMFIFENIGFSKTVDGIKYLICADCEIGPIGWHNVEDKTAYYIAADRVQYK